MPHDVANLISFYDCMSGKIRVRSPKKLVDLDLPVFDDFFLSWVPQLLFF